VRIKGLTPSRATIGVFYSHRGLPPGSPQRSPPVLEHVVRDVGRLPVSQPPAEVAVLGHAHLGVPELVTYLACEDVRVVQEARQADTADEATTGRVLRGAFEQPLSPTDLAGLWPTGPAIGSRPGG